MTRTTLNGSSLDKISKHSLGEFDWNCDNNDKITVFARSRVIRPLKQSKHVASDKEGGGNLNQFYIIDHWLDDFWNGNYQKQKTLKELNIGQVQVNCKKRSFKHTMSLVEMNRCCCNRKLAPFWRKKQYFARTQLNQCDQMTTILFQLMAIYSKKLTNSISKLPNQTQFF